MLTKLCKACFYVFPVLSRYPCEKLHWSKSAPSVSMVCKCFHNSSSHFLAFLCELSKKVLTISKQGLWKVLEGLKRVEPFTSAVTEICDTVLKSSAILNLGSFFVVFRRLPTRAAKSLSWKMRNLLSFATCSTTRLQGKMASVQRKEIKSSNVLVETLQDHRYLYWFCEKIYLYIYFGNVATVRHKALPSYCNMSLHEGFSQARENSQHFATSPTVFSRNDVWRTSADILH